MAWFCCLVPFCFHSPLLQMLFLNRQLIKRAEHCDQAWPAACNHGVMQWRIHSLEITTREVYRRGVSNNCCCEGPVRRTKILYGSKHSFGNVHVCKWRFSTESSKENSTTVIDFDSGHSGRRSEVYSLMGRFFTSVNIYITRGHIEDESVN